MSDICFQGIYDPLLLYVAIFTLPFFLALLSEMYNYKKMLGNAKDKYDLWNARRTKAQIRMRIPCIF